MSAELHSFISDVLSSRGLVDADGFALRSSNELTRLAQWDEEQIARAIGRVRTDLYRRNAGWPRQKLTSLLASRLVQKWPTSPVDQEGETDGIIKVLLIGSNPIIELTSNTSEIPLALDEEMREIQKKVRASKHRDSIQLACRTAARPDDLIQALNEEQPQVVHFSGHGTSQNELIFLDDQRQPNPVSKRALEMLFKTMSDNIRVVVLNACFSEAQAISITKYIDCAIGMKREIGDEAAIVFASSFYRALGFGHSVKRAFDEGITALELAGGTTDSSVVRLLCRKRVDPSRVRLLGH